MALTKNDSVVTSFIFTEVGPFFEGIAWVNSGTLYAYVDTNGNLLTTYKFTEAGNFTGGLAVVQVDSTNYGLLNTGGEWVIPPDYTEMNIPIDGIVCVNLGGKWGLFDTTGQMIKEANLKQPPIIHSRDFIVVKDGKYGVVNSKDEIVIPFRYDFISRHGELFIDGTRILIGHL